MAKIFKMLVFSIILALTFGICSLSGLSSEFGQAKWMAEDHAQDVGTLHVVITPQAAIDDGAQWRLDGGLWRNSGVYLGLEVGSYTIEYKAIDGWDAPSNQNVDIIKDQITEVTGTYTVTRYLRVFISPQEAIDAGAQWNADGGPWHNSGDIVRDLSVGDHTVNYKNVFGWNAPPSETVAIVAGQTTETTGIYIQQFGSLQVTITPQAVIDAGAQWNVDGGQWQDSGATISGLPTGDHTVIYMGIFGWNRPDETVTVYEDQVTEITATYTEITSGITIRVPIDYVTIQAAIDAASDGDTVLIADGIYAGLGNKDLDFKGKAIKLVSENGPDNCIIDCEGSGRGFYFHNGERQNSVIFGLTIKGGQVGTDGGGIYCTFSSPTITNCTISGNKCGVELWAVGGGGVYFEHSSATITNCTISGNGCSTGEGGGIYCEHSSVTITNCTISENRGGDRGPGGGISCRGSSLIITNCAIFNNRAGGNNVRGGGIFCDNSSLIIINSTIFRNEARGGWVTSGGGIFYSSSSLTIINSTFFGNMADLGGGICSWDSSATITNCILWDNIPNQISGVGTVTYSDIQGGYPSEGNIDADPLFVDPKNGDYHLTSDSPCIDTGTSEGAPNTDIEGTPRPQGAGYDMGAYEFKAIVYVASDGLCGGKSPCYSQIQDAIDWDGIIFNIKAEQGIYDENIVFDEPKEIVFQGGLDSTFTTVSGQSTVRTMRLSNGTIRLNKGCLGIVGAGD